MAFRKRNVILTARGPPGSGSSSSATHPSLASASASAPTLPSSPARTQPPAQSTGPPRGVRPSPINGQYTTSTGTPSLDALLAGHAGLPLGCSLLIEEPGTTDYGGALLRYYAAEGIVQGHAVTVIGPGEHWVRELPAVSGDAGPASGNRSSSSSGGGGKEGERMKIAWRYERLKEFGSGIGGSRGSSPPPLLWPLPLSKV